MCFKVNLDQAKFTESIELCLSSSPDWPARALRIESFYSVWISPLSVCEFVLQDQDYNDYHNKIVYISFRFISCFVRNYIEFRTHTNMFFIFVNARLFLLRCQTIKFYYICVRDKHNNIIKMIFVEM